MNAERRNRIENLSTQLRGIQEQLTEIKDVLSNIRDDEQEAHDNMPEPIQAGAKGDAAQECVDQLSDAVDGLETLESEAGNAIEALENATNN